jgi:hypothetical protein
LFAAVDIDQAIGPDLGHHVAGPVVPVLVENLGGDLGALVVARRHRVGLDQQLPARVGPVGEEVTQLGDVDQFVVEHPLPADRAVPGEDSGLGQAVAVDSVYVQRRIQERLHLPGQRRAADETAQHPTAQQPLPQFGRGVLGVCRVGSFGDPAVDCAAVVLEQHLDYTWNHAHFGGPHQCPVCEQRGQIGLGYEVVGTTGDERRRQRQPSAEVVQGQEVHVEHRYAWR